MQPWNKLMAQKHTGPFLGAVKDITSRTMIYVSMLNFIQVTATFYYTTLRPPILQYTPWLNFGIYFGVLVIFVVLIMLFEYKLVMPSTFTFINQQEYAHENLIRRDMQEIKTILDRKTCPHCGKEIYGKEKDSTIN